MMNNNGYEEYTYSMDTYAEEDLNPAADAASKDSFLRKFGKALLYGFVILLHVAQIFTGNKRTRGVSNLLSFSINGFEI